MHRNNRFGFRGDGSLNIGGADHQRITVNVDHDRHGAQQLDHVEGGNPGLRRGDDFVAGADAQRHQRDVHARCGGADGDRMLTAEGGTEVAFQLLVLRPGGDPTGTQHFLYRGDFFIADGRTRERQN